MRIEQITITKIIADEGKILKRKGDGHFYGTEVTLGYNYYEAGVALSQPKLETPDDYEEVDMPEGLEERPIIDHVKRLKRANELVQKNHEEINTLGLTDEQALEVKEMFPMWDEFVELHPDMDRAEMKVEMFKQVFYSHTPYIYEGKELASEFKERFPNVYKLIAHWKKRKMAPDV